MEGLQGGVGNSYPTLPSSRDPLSLTTLNNASYNAKRLLLLYLATFFPCVISPSLLPPHRLITTANPVLLFFLLFLLLLAAALVACHL
jgi:hypothetical protein